MAAKDHIIFNGTPYVQGTASGKIISSDLELSFWGGVHPETGKVIDRYHPLSGRFLKDTILVIPGGRGSCTGSAVILELLLNGNGPKALVFQRREDIVTLGVIIAEELFEKSIPVLSLDEEDFKQLLRWNGEMGYVHGGRVSNGPFPSDPAQQLPTFDVDTASSTIQLSGEDKAVLDGSRGEAVKIAMKIILRFSQMVGAHDLLCVSQAHVDAAWYGPGSLAFAKRLCDQGGKFRVPTTMNAVNVDRQKWRALGVQPALGTVCEEMCQIFLDMGGKQSFTCAPYLLDSAPKVGEVIAWGESNAVIYANSVLGARTLKYSNMLETLIALTGRAPKTGVYEDENRLASVWVHVQPPKTFDDALWPMIGYSIGAIAGSRIPVITGFEHMRISTDAFKAFSAAFGTSGSGPMYHIVGATPDAPTLEAVCRKDKLPPRVDIGIPELTKTWDIFNQARKPRQVGLLSLGNPHFSFQEIKKLADLCRGKVKHPKVAVVVTTGRSQCGLASQAGYVEELEKFGVTFLADTCWCSIREPVVPEDVQVVMTNSGKYIHYGPGITGKDFCFGSLEMCVDAACSGVNTGKPPAWLDGADI